MTADKHLPRDEHGKVRNPYTDPDGVMGGGLSQLRGSSSWVETDFESKSHPDMEQMIASADPKTAEHLGGKLKRAAKTIKKIGEDLKDRKGRVDWEGEGADSFDNWVTQMSSATLRLANMAEGTGTWMEHAAQTLREVQRDMPKYSESAKKITDDYNPAGPKNQVHLPQGKHGGDKLRGPSDGEYIAADKQLKDDHGEAVRQMKKLAESYSQSSGAVHTAEKPTFPPMPKDLMPPEPRRGGEHIGGAGHQEPQAAERRGPTSPASSGSPGVGGSSSGTTSGAPDQPRTDLAGGAASPQPTAPAPTHTPDGGPSHVTPPSNSAAPTPGVATPPVRKTVGGGGPPRPGSVQGQSSARDTPRAAGDVRPSPTRPPAAPGQTGANPSRLGARSPGDHGNGIYGGRPAATGQTPRGIPRGTVVGGEQRPGASNLGSSNSGRSLAARPGGVVGAPQNTQTPGVNRQFTQGGTGLVRDMEPWTSQSPGAGPYGNGESGRASTAGARNPDDEPRRRPESPVEDNDTWSPCNPRIVPPVIE